MIDSRSSSNVVTLSGRSSAHAVLDIGSTKITCLVVRSTRRRGGPNTSRSLWNRSHGVEVLGFGLTRSHGVKSGVIVDMDSAEIAVRRAVAMAERSSGMTIDGVTVSVSSGRLGGRISRSSPKSVIGEVSPGDIRSVLSSCAHSSDGDGRVNLHMVPLGYTLDGSSRVMDPVGMTCESVRADVHLVSADSSAVHNIELCVNRAHLSVDEIVASPYASGLSSLLSDEASTGCVLVDMGGGTTTVSVFVGGSLVFADGIAIGGQHVTTDIARCLSMSVDSAERSKVLYGTCSYHSDEFGSSPSLDADLSHIDVCDLSRIIRPRIEETFEIIRDRVRRSGFGEILSGRVVLTGGASHLAGVTDLAGSTLGGRVRLGRPLGISGLPRAACGSSFSTVTGLCVYPQHTSLRHGLVIPRHGISSDLLSSESVFARVGQWLRRSF